MTHHPVDSIVAFAILVGVVAGSFVFVGSQPVGYIGITATDVTPAIAQQMHLPSASGVLVVEVLPSSPAEKAGLRGGDKLASIDGQNVSIGGDVIKAVNGNSVANFDDLSNQLKDKNINDKITFTVLRGGNTTKDITMTVEPKPR